MEVILFRHGIAEDRRTGLPDADRELTPRGRERTAAAARGLAWVIGTPEAILTSPKKRALATAQLLGAELDLVPREAKALAEGGPADVLRVVQQAAPVGCIIVVGHEPTLSDTIRHLCGGLSVQMKKAAAACVALTDTQHPRGNATLRWLIPPRTLRQLGE